MVKDVLNTLYSFAADTLPYLMQASILLDEGVAPTLLQLLQSAICGVKSHGQSGGAGGGVSSDSSTTSPVKVKGKKEKDRSSKGDGECRHKERELLMKWNYVPVEFRD